MTFPGYNKIGVVVGNGDGIEGGVTVGAFDGEGEGAGVGVGVGDGGSVF